MNLKNSSVLAIPFITFHQNEGFKLSNQAQQFLSSLPENRQLGIVSIVGKYRTGKSFFVNRVLLDQKNGGFQVGPTINPCTKGLWLWKKTIPSESNKNMDLILIDTEGFGGMDQNANHDSRIFLFSLLLSSYFIYNSVGSIDQNAINTLNLIINLAKDIQTKTNNSSDDESQFPSFLWVVRDFTLKLVDKNQNPITPKEYLENALEFQKGTSDAIENKNKIRRLLKHFFQDRDCNVMVRPTEAEKDLQRLDQIDNSLLRPEFVTQVKNIRSKIYTKAKCKKINGQSLNGNLLVSLCKGYMQTINKGHLPNVQSAWFYVCRSQGLKAVNSASKILQNQLEVLFQNPIKQEDMAACKQRIREKVMEQFRKKAMNSEQGHPDLVQKLERRIDEYFAQFNKKNVQKWTDVYRQTAEQKIEKIRERIYCDQYEDFSEFVKDYEQIKAQFDAQTTQGDSAQKWRYFNELSQNLYRLAGQTITEKMNNNLLIEKQKLQQKITMQEQSLKEHNKELNQEKQKLRTNLMDLERENNRLKAIEESSTSRIQQYKHEYDQLYQKYRMLEAEHEASSNEIQRLRKQQKSRNYEDMEVAKTQLFSIKSSMEKERALFEMQKQYMQQQIDRYKERCNTLEIQNRKIRTHNTKISSDFEQLESKYQEKCQEVDLLQETNNNYSKKIQKLLIENSKKNELVGDHNQWLLEKSYLENQVSFLKNTMNQNKKLHDALLVAFQKSISTNNQQANAQLLEANKNLSQALEKVEDRYRILDQKYNKLKDLKKIMKNCSAMQCSSCSKLVPSSTFILHVEQCINEQNSQRQKTLSDSNKQNIHITVSQTVVKQSEDRKKPYTEYIVQIMKGDSIKWKVNKRYKQFSDLHQLLINKYPYIKFPPSCNFLADMNSLVNNKKNMIAQQRRKSLQQYLRDLSKIQEIRESEIFKEFLEIKENGRESANVKKSISKSGLLMQESGVKKRGVY